MRQLLDDTGFWIEDGTYSADEIAARFHHKLVWIHPYSNGNGRHARLATDLLLTTLGQKRFSWGSENLVNPCETRAHYTQALRAADNHDIAPLLAFVRSYQKRTIAITVKQIPSGPQQASPEFPEPSRQNALG